jgi:hypothetical protein
MILDSQFAAVIEKSMRNTYEHVRRKMKIEMTSEQIAKLLPHLAEAWAIDQIDSLRVTLKDARAIVHEHMRHASDIDRRSHVDRTCNTHRARDNRCCVHLSRRQKQVGHMSDILSRRFFNQMRLIAPKGKPEELAEWTDACAGPFFSDSQLTNLNAKLESAEKNIASQMHMKTIQSNEDEKYLEFNAVGFLRRLWAEVVFRRGAEAVFHQRGEKL